LDSSLSRQYEGAGLGLTLVHRLVELHHGSISVESELGKGSRFTVSLPWREVTEAAETEGKPELPESDTPIEKETASVVTAYEELEDGQPLILLVEDNEDSINTVSDYLLAKGYRMAIAWNGEEAIQRVKEEKPDVILMDVQMPVMNGLEAIYHIRADPDLMNIPIIALTALAMPGDRERCLKAGANDYIAKPVSLKGLVKTIEIQLNRNLIEERI
jgi:CheY-like chemotaxis protein